MWLKRKRRYQAIEPDEILIDAQNLPGFDSTRLEGKLERPIERRAYQNFFSLILLVALVFVGQLGMLQIINAETLRERAEGNRLNQTLIVAERGSIVDRHGEALALNTPDETAGFTRRSYPLGPAASHVVGYVSYPKKDQNGNWFQTTTGGVSGVELVNNFELAGVNGMEIKETTALGEVVSGSVVEPPQEGKDIVLSLDARWQEKLYELIRLRAEEASFIGGSGVIIDIHTGEIYALASYPSYDPEILSSGSNTEVVEGYFTNKNAPLIDRAVSGLYTPGSVVKPFVALAGLEEGIITPEKSIYSSGSISIPNPYNPTLPSVFRDWKAHGWTDMREALAVSSDVYFYALGGGYEDQQGLGITAIEEWMRRFGFGASTGVVLEEEASGVVPNPTWKAETFDGERWFLGNTYHTAIGQYGFQVTTLQLARAVSALANGGVLRTPTIFKDESGPSISLPVEEKNLHVVREGMREAVLEGTAAALNISGVEVAGKTGTAEVGARKEFINSLIVGFFPYENPQFAFAVVMERARAGTTAGAPLVMRQFLEWLRDEGSVLQSPD